MHAETRKATPLATGYPTLTEPFLRWAGGKRWLRSALVDVYATRTWNTYIEPFLGSGAFFFAAGPRNAILGDINRELITAYKIVQSDPEALVSSLKRMRTDGAAYGAVRSSRPRSELKQAARFLYLNRLGFNGIYRVNRRGEFNVPFAGDRRLDYFWRSDLLLEASRALAGVTLQSTDFANLMKAAGAGDLVYCDPVYASSARERFDRYTSEPFGDSDKARLEAEIISARARGATVLLSWPDDELMPAANAVTRTNIHMRRSTIHAKATAALSHHERLAIFEPDQVAGSIASSERASGAVEHPQASETPCGSVR
jgi:DNA adenine methylase